MRYLGVTLTVLLIQCLGSSVLFASDFPEIGQREFFKEDGLVYSNATEQLFTGYVLYYYTQGQLESKKLYVNGKLEGVTVSWHENGQKKQEVTYSGGQMHGPCQGWHSNGAIAFEGNYKNGKQDGTWVQWDAQGNVISEKNYSAEVPKKFVLVMPKPPS